MNYKDLAEAHTSDDNILARISDAVDKQYAIERKIAQHEADIKELKAAHKNLSETVIPTLMDEAQQEEIVTKSGIIVSIAKTLRASIPKESLPEAIGYLVEHGHEGIIKSNVVVSYPKAFHESAVELFKNLQSTINSGQVKLDSGVHHMTLTSWVKEQMDEGVDVPHDIFGIHIDKSAKLKVK